MLFFHPKPCTIVLDSLAESRQLIDPPLAKVTQAVLELHELMEVVLPKRP